MRAWRLLLTMGLALTGAWGCGGEGDTSGSGATGASGGSGGAGGEGGTGGAGGAGAAGGGGAGGGVAPLCTEPKKIACEDEVLLDMNLQPDPAPGLITNQADGAGWITKIDATAGGPFTSTPHSYVYGRFAPEGLVKVDISDEASLTSMDWDVAFRRYVARINSDDSGPSCVQAARVPGKTYEEVTSVPPNLKYNVDDYFTESCDFIPDGSGLENSPATALSAYWSYPGCVQMSDYVFVIALASGKHVKFIVDSYYSPSVQEQCDTMGSVPMGNTGSANFVVRWQFLD